MNSPPAKHEPAPLRSPRLAIDRLRRLSMQRDVLRESRNHQQTSIQSLESRLAIADDVTAALEKLTDHLFADVVRTVEQQLSVALQEVLEQPLQLKVTRGVNGGRTTISFHIERDGNAENILDGQGGSVANVLSVGLRLLALTMLPAKEHRRFLVLDEQDCWLRPDLVPRLVRIVEAAGKALGFQVLLISHHDHRNFENLAERIIQLTPGNDGVRAETLDHE